MPMLSTSHCEICQTVCRGTRKSDSVVDWGQDVENENVVQMQLEREVVGEIKATENLARAT